MKGPESMKPSYKVSDQIQWNPDLLRIYGELGYDVDISYLPEKHKTNGAKELLVIRL